MHELVGQKGDRLQPIGLSSGGFGFCLVTILLILVNHKLLGRV